MDVSTTCVTETVHLHSVQAQQYHMPQISYQYHANTPLYPFIPLQHHMRQFMTLSTIVHLHHSSTVTLHHYTLQQK
jgi:hypothetical protein